MTNNEVEKIFIEILESTPGVKLILEDGTTDNIADFNVHESDKDTWNFNASIKILKNTSAKELVKNISNLLKYRLVKKGQKVGKINLFIGELIND
ncbi:hypothetical protein HYE26_02510 [Mycoplasmopsis bovis]|nr:hypothetical protein [Mycoplasmopsis bovis]QQH23272.1 hypothetical protein HYE26_02510 [Mycoplasmopsis bovis]